MTESSYNLDMPRGLLERGLRFLTSYLSAEPSYLILFATARCNARCPHCFYRREIDAADAKTELTLAELERIASSLPKLLYLSVGGGEPFLRDDLPDIVRAFHERSGILICSIVTNGFYTDRVESLAKTVLERCPDLRLKIQVSIDDFGPDHDARRGVPGIHARAMETLRRLRALPAAHGRLQVDIGTCLTRSNLERAPALVDDLRLRVDFDDHQILYPRGSAADPGEKEVPVDAYEALLRRAAERDPERSRLLTAVNSVAREGVLRFLKTGAQPWPCLAGRKFISITERGVLQPCEVLKGLRPDFSSDIADLRACGLDVRAALASPKGREVAAFVRDTRCRCSFECAANCNVLFSFKEALRVGRALLP